MHVLTPKISVGAVTISASPIVCKIFKKVKRIVVNNFPKVENTPISSVWTVVAPITRVGALFDREGVVYLAL